LIRSEKAAALGRLSAAMAHEINKPNFIIRNLADILTEDDSMDRNTRDESLAAILRQSENIARSVDRLLSFAKPQAHGYEWVDVELLLKELHDMMKKISPQGIVFEMHLQSPLLQVYADRVQLQQLFSNLLINAVQSVTGSGRIVIEARTLPHGGEDERKRSLGKAGAKGEMIEVAITDTGQGILPENLDRIFEPYFTTKPQGEGYGLGLAICQEITDAHGGTIDMESVAGRGSTVSVRLPRQGLQGIGLARDMVVSPEE